MPRVVVQLKPEAAQALRAGANASAALNALKPTVRDYKTAIQPLDPILVHPVLAPFFIIDLATPEDAQALVARLQGNSVVIAAYTEPQVDHP